MNERLSICHTENVIICGSNNINVNDYIVSRKNKEDEVLAYICELCACHEVYTFF